MIAQSVRIYYQRVFMESFMATVGDFLDRNIDIAIDAEIDAEIEELMREAGHYAANVLRTRRFRPCRKPIQAVPQADGYSGTLPEDVTWIGEIDGKKYTGLGKPESGPLSHLPEGSH